jgi:hypothetical protein
LFLQGFVLELLDLALLVLGALDALLHQFANLLEEIVFLGVVHD